MCTLCGTTESFVIGRTTPLTAFTEAFALGDADQVSAILRLSTGGSGEIQIRTYRSDVLRALAQSLRQLADDADRISRGPKAKRLPTARVMVIT
jgi:hypothetical protein